MRAAEASSSVLCSGYAACSDKGYSHAGYATHKSTSYWRMYTGTNCTNYVAYRLVATNGMPNVRPKAGVGNAEDWGFAMSSITNSTPTVGSVAWWGKTGHHVAYVEKVVSSSEIWVSESNWSGAFDWRKITKSGSGWPDGFIHFADLKIINNDKPTIRGTVKVGGALSAWGGDWSPKGNTYAYRWRSDGKSISGATGKTYTPTAAQLGKPLTVSVTATRPSYPTTSVSSKAIKVAPGTLSTTEAPAITGTARVDEQLTASTGTWSPTGSTYAYQWLVDGTAVPGAIAPVFTPGPDDVDRRVTVEVTASKAGYDDVTVKSAPTNELAPGTLAAISKPVVAGAPKVGGKLTASPGTWSRTGLTYAYQWFVDGTAVSGSEDSTFVPRAADLDRPITVHVTAKRHGYATTTAVSAQTAKVVHGTFTSVSKPVVTGNARVGSRLSASTGTWSPTGTYTYQWYADGHRITGATEATFIPTSHERGAKLRVRVAARQAGYGTGTRRSDNTPVIGYGHIGVSVAPTVTGSTRLGSVVTVSPGTHTPAGATERYQWLRDGKVIDGATGRSHHIKTGDLGHKVSARVRLSAAGYTARTVTSQEVGPAKVTSTLRVSADTGTRKVTFSIRVSADGVAAPDGTVRVRFAGDQHRTVKVVNGRATLSLTSQASGEHTYVFEFGGTSTITSASHRKKVTIG